MSEHLLCEFIHEVTVKVTDCIYVLCHVRRVLIVQLFHKYIFDKLKIFLDF